MDKVSGNWRMFRYMREEPPVRHRGSEQQVDVGFTVNLPSYHSAFLFDHHRAYYELKTVIHEFGHFSAFCLAPSDDFPLMWPRSNPGVEMLFCPTQGNLFARRRYFACALLSDLNTPWWRAVSTTSSRSISTATRV